VSGGISGTAKGVGNSRFTSIRERKRPLMPLTSMNCSPLQVMDENPDPEGQRILVRRWEEAAFAVSVDQLQPGLYTSSMCELHPGNLPTTGGRCLRRFIRR
jgi:hypothetical protein